MYFMKIAVISDIHANIYALEAVLRDIEKKQVDIIYCAGDLVGYAPFPNEVVELVRAKKIPTVMGNYDDGVGNMRFICGCDYKDEKARVLGEKSIMWTKEHTSEKNKEFLRGLPREIDFTAGKYRAKLVHGSPRRLNEYLHENTDENYAAGLMAETGCDVLVCGHTHVPYHREVAGKHLINAGSVGKPKHGDPAAAYVILDFGKSLQVDVNKVPYDYEKTAKAIEESGLPDEFAGPVRTGSPFITLAKN